LKLGLAFVLICRDLSKLVAKDILLACLKSIRNFGQTIKETEVKKKEKEK